MSGKWFDAGPGAWHGGGVMTPEISIPLIGEAKHFRDVMTHEQPVGGIEDSRKVK